MTENKLTVQRYMEGFRTTDREAILSCLTDDVEWEIPGVLHTRGKAEFSHHIVDPGFAGHPVITVKRMTEEADVVIAEGTVLAQRADGTTLPLAFCDVFELKQGRIRRLVSYLVHTAVFVLFASVGVHAAYAQDTAAVAGCYAAEPALTYSAAGALERGDSSWVIAQLTDGGVARRPLLERDRDRRSSWQLAGDTLDAYFFDGLVGWRLRLTRVPAGWSGVATYLTDGIVAGEPPFRRAIMLRRRRCP